MKFVNDLDAETVISWLKQGLLPKKQKRKGRSDKGKKRTKRRSGAYGAYHDFHEDPEFKEWLWQLEQGALV
jgi:hypothetical protein